jgi:hypothetical protein
MASEDTSRSKQPCIGPASRTMTVCSILAGPTVCTVSEQQCKTWQQSTHGQTMGGCDLLRSQPLSASAAADVPCRQLYVLVTSQMVRAGLNSKEPRCIPYVCFYLLLLQALQHIAAASDPTASHNCWAFKVAGSARSNDDGEPGGTGGCHGPTHTLICQQRQ